MTKPAAPPAERHVGNVALIACADHAIPSERYREARHMDAPRISSPVRSASRL